MQTDDGVIWSCVVCKNVIWVTLEHDNLIMMLMRWDKDYNIRNTTQRVIYEKSIGEREK